MSRIPPDVVEKFKQGRKAKRGNFRSEFDDMGTLRLYTYGWEIARRNPDGRIVFSGRFYYGTEVNVPSATSNIHLSACVGLVETPCDSIPNGRVMVKVAPFVYQVQEIK